MSFLNTARPTVAVTDLHNLSFNFRSAKEFIGNKVKYLAVVKANAYGHGAVECSKQLEADGIDWFGVALPEEGIELRNAGITKPILVLGGFWPGQENIILDNGLTPVIFDLDRAATLNEAANARDMVADIHVKIDTGMGRIGVRYDAVAGFSTGLKRLKNLRLDGSMTHFAAADDLAQNAFTETQIRRFYEAVDVFKQNGFDPEYIDLANSPGAVAHPDSRGNMVRLGGILYGLGGDILPHGIPKPQLKPVMSLRSKIAVVKSIPRGESIGYGLTYTTPRDSLIAAIPIGYHDGYRRGLSNKAKVIINGEFAPVVGRVSMDWTLVDVTDVPDAKTGDDVFLIGEQNGLSIKAEDLGAILDTISYEITCGISQRVTRYFR